jgi:hypothetical protein
MKILNSSDSRDEQQEILAYVNSLPKRLEIARLVEQKEEELSRQCIDEMRKRYSHFHTLHDRGWEKGYRDVQLVIRYMVQGMLMDDLDVASEKLLMWLRTIVGSLGLTPRFNRDTYTILREGFRQKLPADAFAMMEPQLNKTIEVMSDIPEPYKPAV